MNASTEIAAKAAVTVAVIDLTGFERTAALYASDMPNVKRHHTGEQVHDWIVQGIERLGFEEARAQAEYYQAWQLLRLNGLMTPQIQARHEQRFPKARRLLLANQTASASICCHEGMSDAARARNGAAVVDGDCPCGGTREILIAAEEGQGTLSMACPVHRLPASTWRRRSAGWVLVDQRDEPSHTPSHTREARP